MSTKARLAAWSTAAVIQGISLLGERGRLKARHMSWAPRMSALSAGQVVRARRRSLRWVLDLEDNLQRTFYFTGWCEHEFLMFFKSELRPGDTYLDVGGHIGIDALIVAREVGPHGRVVVFEPSPDSAAALRAGARRNRLRNVEVHELALGVEAGAFEMRLDPEWGARDAGVRSKYNAGPVLFEVQVVAFDEWVQGEPLDEIDIDKLDVEGAELEALTGRMASLSSYRPRAVIVEVTHQRLARLGQSEQELDQVMKQCGYEQHGRPLLENIIFRRVST